MEATMICNICGKSCNSAEELRDHQQTAHAAAVSTHRRSHHEVEPDADEQETAA
jgi:hypothetical protein